MNDQWIRRLGLVVFSGEKGLDLSEFHVRFEIAAADLESPNNASIRVYNLSRETVQKIRGEFSEVVVNAGYQNGNYGVIFQGTIKQFRIGKENNTDTYLDILAADGDIGYNQGVINISLAKGTTLNDTVAELSKAMPGVEISSLEVDPQHRPTIRGQVLFGMAREHMRNVAATTNKSWSIQNGQVVFLENNGYDVNKVVELNSGTGLIGIPEQTDNGIQLSCLLNSKIRIGTSIKLNNSIITQMVEQNPNSAPIPYNQRVGLYSLAPLSKDGVYRVFVVEHVGDTRGNSWMTNVIALAVSQSAPADQAVQGL